MLSSDQRCEIDWRNTAGQKELARKPQKAGAASADFKDIPAAAGPPRRGGSVPKRFEAVSEQQPPPRPSSRPGSTESQEQGRGCPRCGRQLAGRALVMHLKSCGITRSRGDPFAPSDQEERRGQSTGPTMEARSPPLPARKARDIREEDNYKIKFRLEVDFLSSTLPCHLSVVFPTLEMFEAGLALVQM
eukprot:symbB.v1.2.015584.t1/scaffold1127.1/size253144/6